MSFNLYQTTWDGLKHVSNITEREREVLQHGPWDDVPGIYLPTGVLYVCYSLMDDPPYSVIALLGPITVQEVTEYYKIKRRPSVELWKQMKGKKTRKPKAREALCQTLKETCDTSCNQASAC